MSVERLGGRFLLLELAGKGAAGDVFRAVDEESGRTVAVKCLAGRLDDERAEERFTREARLLSTIDSPHVVRYVGHGKAPDGLPFLAVGWLDGEDLGHRQRRRPLDGPAVVDVIEQAAAGLSAIHAIGVVHRDVKPSNIYVSESNDGRLHVTMIDLGIAYTRGEPSLTRVGTMVGTPSYMAPEQVLAGVPLSSRTDVFSLGVVLFELITGEKPYRGDDVLTIVAKIALQDPPRVRDLVPSIPRAVDAIVARAMAKDPKDRFASVTAFAEALASAPPFDPVLAIPTDGGATLSKSMSASIDSMTISTIERRVVTVVFARFARADSASHEAFFRIADQHGGVAHALLAIAHVAVFGGAVSMGDEALRAARAALAASRELRSAEISIATCRAVGGALGLSSDAIERGAAESAFRTSSVRIDEPTARLLGDTFEISVNGSTRSLIGERAPEKSARTLLGRETPCVGRDRELAQLEAIFSEVESEPVARAVVVIGAPGAGKSRVRHELTRILASRSPSPLVLLARGSAVSEGAPFALVASAIRGLSGVREDEDLAAQRYKIGRTIADAERADLLPLVAQIAGVAGVIHAPGDDGVLVSDRLRTAFTQWLAGLLRKRSVAFVLEDAQWADSPSIALMNDALGSLSERPLFVLALARKEVETRFPSMWEQHSPETLRLSKLTKKSCDALLRHAIGNDLEPKVVESILERADGNAFYLEELIRAVAESRARGEAGDQIALPDTVLGMVQTRLDALGSDAKRLVKAASIFGETAWARGVADVLASGERPIDIDRELALLSTSEVFERRSQGRFVGESEYVFRHALLRDAAYELLPEEDRARAHLRAGVWLEANGEHEALVLARHFDLGRAPERAASHYAKAAEQALFGSDFSAVIACATKALAYQASDETSGELHLLVAEALRWSGDMKSALDAASSASRMLRRGSRLWFSAMREIVAAQGRLGNNAVIDPLAERILDTPADRGAAGSKIAALVPAAIHVLYRGDLAGSEALARSIEALAFETQTLEPRAVARLHQLRAALATQRDDPETGIHEQSRALTEFEQARDHRASTLVRANMSFALLQVGQVDRAEEMLREALQIATRLGLISVRALVLQNLGVALTYAGRYQEAILAESSAIAIFQSLKDPRLEASSRVSLSLALLALGDFDQAEVEAKRVLASNVEPPEVGAHAVIARCFLGRGESAAALRSAESAQRILEKLVSVEESEIFARLTLAEALAAVGDHQRAKTALIVAKTRIEARRAKVRDPALKKSLVERIPEHARVLELCALWDVTSP